MIIKPIKELVERLEQGIMDLTQGCQTVVVAVSGGVDSSVTATLARMAKGARNVVGLWRGINSDPRHQNDAHELAKAIGIDLFEIDITKEFESIVNKLNLEARRLGRTWIDEANPRARKTGWQGAYASMRSRLTTPLAGFLAKAMDCGQGRVIGTGNAEEDVLLRYFDKFGDGAVDCNPINGLLKSEVRQIAIYLSKQFPGGQILERIAHKLPSADLLGIGDEHNDEDELSRWAKEMGYPNARITYGGIEKEGTIAWVLRQENDFGVITGKLSRASANELVEAHMYEQWEAETICFVREIEKRTRHKDLGLPGIPRSTLLEEGYII